MELRRLKENDIQGMLEWMHDPNVFQFFRFSCENYTEENVAQFIKQAQIDFDNDIHRHYAIVDENDQYLGTISLKDIDKKSLNAEYAISLRSNVHGKGIATWATKEILKIAFLQLGLLRVYLNVLSNNTSAIHLYEKCGFVYEGEFRQHINIRGQVCSLKWYSILRQEYLQKGEVETNENNA